MITLRQTGDAPIQFEGVLIAKAGGPSFRGKDCNRWYVLELYQTDNGYVLSISYQTKWEGEPNRFDVFECRDQGQVRDALLDWEPIQAGIGFPPHPNYKDKQARLVTALENQYDELVSDLLTSAGVSINL